MAPRSFPVSPPLTVTPGARPPKLLGRLRIHLHTRHYSIRTEEDYVDWACRFILFHGKCHPQDMGRPRWRLSWATWPSTGRCRLPRRIRRRGAVQLMYGTDRRLLQMLRVHVSPRAPSHAGRSRRAG